MLNNLFINLFEWCFTPYWKYFTYATVASIAKKVNLSPGKPIIIYIKLLSDLITIWNEASTSWNWTHNNCIGLISKRLVDH